MDTESTSKSLDSDLLKLLEDNDLQAYIEILEKEKIYTIDELKDLTQDDYKELGIATLGERKKFLKLFSASVPVDGTDTLPAINDIPQYPTENYSKTDTNNKADEKPEAIIINNNTGSGTSNNGYHVGLAGVLGGILGAAAVIIIGLIILSNESWSL